MPSLTQSFLGSLAGDALAMPGHWYYDLAALHRDYGVINHFIAPRNPHPDSILWRSTYAAPTPEADILHDQARYWGVRGIHYHQFLAAGENTLNLRLAEELYRMIRSDGSYDADRWLERYVQCLRTPGWHRDTYVEEVHRGFFMNRAKGKKLRSCAIVDEHIGGLASVPALVAATEGMALGELRKTVQLHVALSHQHRGVLHAADVLTCVLHAIAQGTELEAALVANANDFFSLRRAQEWVALTDEEVVGKRLSPACYIEDAFRASLYLAWKYRRDFSGGLIANVMVGGDNCHRGVVVGAVLAAANGCPREWSDGLLALAVHETRQLDPVS